MEKSTVIFIDEETLMEEEMMEETEDVEDERI